MQKDDSEKGLLSATGVRDLLSPNSCLGKAKTIL